MPYQNISATIDSPTKDAILQHLMDIQAALPFLINLTPEERQALPKMGDKSVAFVLKAKEYSSMNPTVIPQYLNQAEWAMDIELFGVLQMIKQGLAPLLEAIDDTQMAVGSEAFMAANTAYNSFKYAASSNVPGMDTIVDDLGERYPGPTGDPDEPEPPAPPLP